ncbi:YeaH/YhbH family protein [Teichococcus oryzae]|uniref:UPF0229 protein F0Q34_00640 n=1 Tax=Teichococcus oryzae TaxID=1608942 RepID=A0A5B2TJU8_9PROT|nr:YeaH/YhbH family protein [Pseudoroseomonas oryzae]KAA2214275.1 YeaH/YhbH family protein [Pseudoroseomonas oryzae]
MDIIDRRPNPHGKNLENRRRVLARARQAVIKAVRDAVDGGTLRETGHGEAVTIPADSLHEPAFHEVFTSGQRDIVLPGNKEFSVGDRIKRPDGKGGGGGSGAGSGASGEGGGGSEDNFRFVLTRDEFLDLFFEDLELPDLVKRDILDTETVSPVRTGISTDGSPSQIDLARSMRQSMARRIGLKRPKGQAVRDLEAEIEALEEAGDEPERLAALRAEVTEARRRQSRIPWVDPVDLRYRRFTPTPKPSARAVMFCLMDVSGSMTESMKDLAKRFFLLLHVFLERRYKRVELVFIRHTEAAEEVDEKTFFTDPRTGGTIVSSALEELIRIQRERYPAGSWNIYAAQASDGDNYGGDTARAVGLLENDILPLVQHFAYIEVAPSGAVIRGETDLWRGYEPLAGRSEQMAMRRVSDRREIFPVFRDLFGKRPAAG